MEGFYTLAEFRQLFGVGQSTIYRAVNAGTLRLTKIGRSSRIARADAKAWADGLPTIGGAR